jgi:hypothetical protein
LSENFITGALPSELAFASFLEVLDLQTNFFPLIPTEIGGLTSLRELRMGDNGALLGGIPTEIGLLTNLELLDLDRNPFMTGTIPTEVGSLSNLQSANFGFTSLSGSMPAEVCAIASNPALFLDTLIVDCQAVPPKVQCDVPTCCSACAD